MFADIAEVVSDEDESYMGGKREGNWSGYQVGHITKKKRPLSHASERLKFMGKYGALSLSDSRVTRELEMRWSIDVKWARHRI